MKEFDFFVRRNPKLWRITAVSPVAFGPYDNGTKKIWDVAVAMATRKFT
jgi:hypothetical protein